MTRTLGAFGGILLLAAVSGRPVLADHLDVPNLFASVCGFCHEDGGRKAGKGPQLMNTERSDDFIRNRIKKGRRGRMPAFGKMFSDEDIDEIIAYIRALKPREGASAQ
ncbi:MAG TPA: cytochrome c [Rhodospirillales bacterium]|nr:cytochrome c [Rhodospirillales bacterium]